MFNCAVNVNFAQSEVNPNRQNADYHEIWIVTHKNMRRSRYNRRRRLVVAAADAVLSGQLKEAAIEAPYITEI